MAEGPARRVAGHVYGSHTCESRAWPASVRTAVELSTRIAKACVNGSHACEFSACPASVHMAAEFASCIAKACCTCECGSHRRRSLACLANVRIAAGFARLGPNEDLLSYCHQRITCKGSVVAPVKRWLCSVNMASLCLCFPAVITSSPTSAVFPLKLTSPQDDDYYMCCVDG